MCLLLQPTFSSLSSFSSTQSSSLTGYNLLLIFLSFVLFFEIIMVLHRCGQCKKEKPENAFDINSNGRRMRSCKPCLVSILQNLSTTKLSLHILMHYYQKIGQ